MKSMPLESWSALEQAVTEIRKANAGSLVEVLFRGQADASWDIKTTLERQIGASDVVADYYRVLSRIAPRINSEFKGNWSTPDYPDIVGLTSEYDRFSLRLSQGLPGYEFMAYLRHHGFPSPLLDWTSSLDVAAFFAFREIPVDPKSDEVAIYALAEQPHNIKGRGSDTPSIYRYGPNIETHRRHFAQKSQYTISVSMESGLGWKFSRHDAILGPGKTNRWEGQDQLWKLTLPRSQRETVLQRLRDANIDAFTLFQSEDSLMEALASAESARDAFRKPKGIGNLAGM
jgi:hypothetical protein